MPKKSLHSNALKEFNKIQSVQKEERKLCKEDRRFYSIEGSQWEGDLKKQFKKKPRFEINKIHLSVIRIFNEYRNNRVTVDFISKQGAQNDQLTETCNGLFRADEENSIAEEAYDNAFEEAVGGGFGAWRLRNCYEDETDEENEKQRISIEPIFDADTSVFFDIDAKRQDKADAKSCFVLYSMDRDNYIETYKDDPESWPKETFEEGNFDWHTPDIVYICEYYLKEPVSHQIEYWQGLDGNEEKYHEQNFEDDPNLKDYLIATGFKMVRNRKITRDKVHKYILSGGKILEDCGYIAGDLIPIVPVYGKRWYVDNIERCMGHVRLCKDSQRLKNMQISKLGEISALSSVEKPILTPDQISGNELYWSKDNIENYPYLLVNPIEDQNGNIQVTGPVAYTRSPNVPQAMAALLQITDADIKELLGNQQAGEEIQPNISGKAVELIQNRLDMQTFIYISNFKKAIRRCGEIWLSMAKEIYVESGRKMKTLNSQKEAGMVELMRPSIDQETGKLVNENDLSNADFDVKSTVGPSTASKRAKTVRELTNMMQLNPDPETRQILTSLTLMNMEGEGLDEIRRYQRKKLIRMGIIKPDEKELSELQKEAEMAAQKGAPIEQQYIQALSKESLSKAQKAQADTMLAAAKAQETKAKTAETLAGIDLKARKQAIESVEAISAIQNKNMAATVPPPIKQEDERNA